MSKSKKRVNSELVRVHLLHEFRERKRRNPKYSLRAFARTLQIDSATLSKILKGSRTLTYANSEKLLSALGTEQSKKNDLLLSIYEPTIDAVVANFFEAGEEE